jgi:hypothetical protein
MCACTETDVRESANDCTLASGKGTVVAEKRVIRCTLQVQCPHPLNALYVIYPRAWYMHHQSHPPYYHGMQTV